jgi:hypothetical protein
MACSQLCAIHQPKPGKSAVWCQEPSHPFYPLHPGKTSVPSVSPVVQMGIQGELGHLSQQLAAVEDLLGQIEAEVTILVTGFKTDARILRHQLD